MTAIRMCICGSRLLCESFTNNFDAHVCTNCNSTNFIHKSDITPPNFNYDGGDEKYSNENYLYGSEMRWAHHQLLKLNWSDRRVLEIGCFNGFFLKELELVGAKPYGHDLNNRAIKVGEDLFGLKGVLSTSLNLLRDLGPYSDVLCVDILEHLDDPKLFLKEMSDFLDRDGKIYISGPTIERKFHDKSDYPPHHKWWFSRKGLELCLKQCGYRVVDIKIQRNGALMFRNFIGCMLSGFSKKEFYGNGVTFSNKNIVIKSIYRILDVFGISIFTLLGIEYCSSLIIAERIE